MNLAEIYLEAVNPARNCMRGYRVTLTLDLFGVYIVETCYGRIGAKGHTLAKSFLDEEFARIWMKRCIDQRRGAQRRVGAVYIERWCSGT